MVAEDICVAWWLTWEMVGKVGWALPSFDGTSLFIVCAEGCCDGSPSLDKCYFGCGESGNVRVA